MSDDMKATLNARLSEINTMLNSDKVTILTQAAIDAKEEKLYRLERQVQRILEIDNFDFGGVASWEAGKDDKIVKVNSTCPSVVKSSSFSVLATLSTQPTCRTSAPR